MHEYARGDCGVRVCARARRAGCVPRVVRGAGPARESFKVEIWVMSCRTFDRYLEHAMLLALQREIQTRSFNSFILDFKRTARNEYFVGTGAALGLFDKSIADGTCVVDVGMPVIPGELPMKVVFS